MKRLAMMWLLVLMVASMSFAAEEGSNKEIVPLRVDTYRQEVARFFNAEDGLPSNLVHQIAIDKDGGVYAATDSGLACFSGKDGRWIAVENLPKEAPDELVVRKDQTVVAIYGRTVYALESQQPVPVASLSNDMPDGQPSVMLQLLNCTVYPPLDLLRQVAFGPSGVAAASRNGVYEIMPDQEPDMLYPSQDIRSWAPRNVVGVVFDAKGRLWFCCPQGVGCRELDNTWKLYTGEEGLPYNDFTCIAAGGDGSVWFGTTKGAIRFDGAVWEYRQGRRWLPNDEVRAIAVDEVGNGWFATSEGVGVIERRSMTLAEKAKFYEDEVDRYCRRTEYGLVSEVALNRPGDRATVKYEDTDNDGLWTSMYGAAECFAYGATKSPESKKRAKSTFEALRFLSVVTQGGERPAPLGFIARSIRSMNDPDPNVYMYTKEKDIRIRQTLDSKWKVIWPRWPKSADGKWYWKCDTSSDELDGHFFFYGLYYDLVAETDEEKEQVREVVRNIGNHLVDHDFCLVDWDGEPTRWAVFGPKQLNNDPTWFAERGLNSLSILSYLATAAHVTGDPKFTNAFEMLVQEHGYANNIMVPKLQNGVGTGNQSDDEMAFMSFYNLIRYSKNLTVRTMAAFAFQEYWKLEQSELNAFFNFAYAASTSGDFVNIFGLVDLIPGDGWLEQSVDSLKRFPLDRVNWSHQNSHRIDIVPMRVHSYDTGHVGRGQRRNGFALPVDERYFHHYNDDPWMLDLGAHGRELGPGTVFLLPYYMGLYHHFIEEK